MTIGLSTIIVLTSCSGSTGNGDDAAGDPERISQEDIDRLSNSLAESTELAEELDLISRRITRQCLEDQGFMIHPRPVPTELEYVQQAVPGTEVPFHELLPDTDVARSEGAGIHEEWLEVTADDYVDPHTPSDTEFSAEGREYADEYFHAKHEMDPVDHNELAPEELKEVLEDDSDPEVGGCVAVANAQIYGSGEAALEDVDVNRIGFDGLPPLPADLDLNPWDLEFETQELLEAHDNWNSCLEDRDAQTVHELVGLEWYLRSFYEQPGEESSWFTGDTVNSEYIPPPEEAPWDFDEAKKREVALMTDVAECADETDFREARQDAWDQTLAGLIIDHEEEMYVWQDQVRTALEVAQELLAE